MYNVNHRFNACIYGGYVDGILDERALLAFDGDLFFDNQDISTGGGIKFTDNFSLSEDFCVGQTMCNQLSVSLVNPGAILSGYKFNSCRALLGLWCADNAYANISNAEVFCTVANYRVGGNNSTTPYLVSDVAIDTQPASPVYALFSYETTLYAIHANGSATKYNLIYGELQKDTTYSTNSFMQNKWQAWAENGTAISVYNNLIYDFEISGTSNTVWGDLSTDIWADVYGTAWWMYLSVSAKVYMCAPFGTFYCERPATTNGVTVDFTAYDKMRTLDIPADDFVASVSYPCSLQVFYEQFCAYYGLTPLNQLPINGSHAYQSAPSTFSNMSARTILGYIAEAAGAIARFDRDEYLEMAWLDNSSVSYPVPWCYSQVVTEYIIQPITGVYLYYNDGSFVSAGTNDNAYIINSNPFFEDKSDGATIAANLLARLTGPGIFPYSPSNVSIPGNWALEAGDIINVLGVYMPIFRQELTWNGGAMAVAEATGNEYRDNA